MELNAYVHFAGNAEEALNFYAAALDGEIAFVQRYGNIQLSVNVESVEKIDEVFEKMSQGGTVAMALQDTFWGARFGMLQDKFGINWMFNCELKK